MNLCVFFNMIKCIVPAIKYIMIYFILLFCRNFWLLCCLSIQNIFFFQKGSVLMKKAYHKRTLPLLKDGLCHRVFFYMGKVIIPSFKYVIVLLCLRFLRAIGLCCRLPVRNCLCSKHLAIFMEIHDQIFFRYFLIDCLYYKVFFYTGNVFIPSLKLYLMMHRFPPFFRHFRRKSRLFVRNKRSL